MPHLKGDTQALMELKKHKFDLLYAFCTESVMVYNDPNQIWRLSCDFQDIVKRAEEKQYLKMEDFEKQRRWIRLKAYKNWHVVEMQQP